MMSPKEISRSLALKRQYQTQVSNFKVRPSSGLCHVVLAHLVHNSLCYRELLFFSKSFFWSCPYQLEYFYLSLDQILETIDPAVSAWNP